MEVTHAATFRSKRRDEHCSSGIRNECNLLQANLTSRSPPRRKVAGRFHRGPQANPTCRIAETQPRTSDARPYIRFVTRSAWVRFGGRATTHRNCQLSTVNCQLSTIRMFATPLWDRLNCYQFLRADCAVGFLSDRSNAAGKPFGLSRFLDDRTEASASKKCAGNCAVLP